MSEQNTEDMSASLLPTEDENMLRDAASGFLDEKAPVAAFRKLRDDGVAEGFDRGVWREMAEMGWAGILTPEAQGGVDMGHAAAHVIADEMGKRLTASPFLSTAVMAATALKEAAGAKRDAWLSEIATGQRIVAFAIDEGSKHAPANIALPAKKMGNGFVLTGAKAFVVDGHAADTLVIAARTSGAPGETEGLSLFAIEKDRKGVSIDRVTTADGRAIARVNLDSVEADGEDLIGDADGGWSILSKTLEAGRAGNAAEMSGVAAGAFGITVDYIKDREQFGQRIGSFQALQHRAADLWSHLELTTSAIINAGRALDGGRDDVEDAVSLAKAKATRVAKLAVSEGVQMHGGVGMTDAFDIGLYMKRARVTAEWLGDYAYHAERIARARGI